ncbi:Membrane-bound lytic murein transglycosylase D [Halioglobus japonicus]|nr:Membrane-bound lytic murein transglycosylase D [Halioglobus japonicus]
MVLNSIFFKKIHHYIIAIYSIVALSACQTLNAPPPPNRDSAAQTPVSEVTAAATDPLDPDLDATVAPAVDPVAQTAPDVTAEEEPDDVWQRMRDDMQWQQTDDVRIDKAREGYLRHVNHIPLVAGKADNYLYYVVEEVQKRNMPVELALVPMVESDWDPFAASYSGAAGLWQIMPATGTHLGLSQDSWYDGRMSVRDSTKVALDYLEELYHQFDQDWFLALAAYNSGAGNIARARKANEAQGLSTDYWSLKLRRQASDYVPKVIALAQIVAEPERYEVELPAVENAPSFEVVEIGRQLQLSKAAELAGIDVETLRALNPGQLRETLSPRQPFELLVPVENATHFEANIATLSPEELVQWQTYKIKPGDSLSGIASAFDIDVQVLQDINSLQGSKIKAGDVLKIPGSSDEAPPPQGYLVRAGDSLSRIAGKFNVSVDDLIDWNSLDPSAYLKPGQELKLYVKGG